jgi:hypothetical protein
MQQPLPSRSSSRLFEGFGVLLPAIQIVGVLNVFGPIHNGIKPMDESDGRILIGAVSSSGRG